MGELGRFYQEAKRSRAVRLFVRTPALVLALFSFIAFALVSLSKAVSYQHQSAVLGYYGLPMLFDSAAPSGYLSYTLALFFLASLLYSTLEAAWLIYDNKYFTASAELLTLEESARVLRKLARKLNSALSEKQYEELRHSFRSIKKRLVDVRRNRLRSLDL